MPVPRATRCAIMTDRVQLALALLLIFLHLAAADRQSCDVNDVDTWKSCTFFDSFREQTVSKVARGVEKDHIRDLIDRFRERYAFSEDVAKATQEALSALENGAGGEQVIEFIGRERLANELNSLTFSKLHLLYLSDKQQYSVAYRQNRIDYKLTPRAVDDATAQDTHHWKSSLAAIAEGLYSDAKHHHGVKKQFADRSRRKISDEENNAPLLTRDEL